MDCGPDMELFFSFQHVCVQVSTIGMFVVPSVVRILKSSIGFLYYDYLLTLPDEIAYIWNSKFRYTTALYFGCRFGIIANLLFLFTMFNLLPTVSC